MLIFLVIFSSSTLALSIQYGAANLNRLCYNRNLEGSRNTIGTHTGHFGNSNACEMQVYFRNILQTIVPYIAIVCSLLTKPHQILPCLKDPHTTVPNFSNHNIYVNEVLLLSYL